MSRFPLIAVAALLLAGCVEEEVPSCQEFHSVMDECKIYGGSMVYGPSYIVFLEDGSEFRHEIQTLEQRSSCLESGVDNMADDVKKCTEVNSPLDMKTCGDILSCIVRVEYGLTVSCSRKQCYVGE